MNPNLSIIIIILLINVAVLIYNIRTKGGSYVKNDLLNFKRNFKLTGLMLLAMLTGMLITVLLFQLY